MKCRFCENFLTKPFVDLGLSPLSNSFIQEPNLNHPETFYPLQVWVCDYCKLVQLDEFERVNNIFNNEYAYFSSFSVSWVEHARQYCEKMIDRFGLNSSSHVIEVASNDGYLLQHFVLANIPVLGIEPAGNTAAIAMKKGVPTVVKFFGRATATEITKDGRRADLLLGNNVLAHVPDINDFVGGLKVALASQGVITLEFPHLLCLMKYNQFDTIYHEHFSYLSLLSVAKILQTHGLEIFDVEELKTHGGSLRIYAQHVKGPQKIQMAVKILEQKEIEFGLNDLNSYASFASRVTKIKYELLRFLIESKEKGENVVGYGAPAKGNTLLNYCGVGTDLLRFTVDKSFYKQGRYLPGTRVPIFSPEKILEEKPDIVLILPWNLKEEIVEEHGYIANWGGRFVVPIPRLEYVS